MNPHERAIVGQYAPAHARAGFAALLALDERLAAIVRAARDPLVGQMRLTWWHEALTALGDGPPPAEPILRALAAEAIAIVPGSVLAGLVDGWEALLVQPLSQAAIAAHGERRGAALFGMAARLIGGEHEHVASAGRGWALADLSRHLTDSVLAADTRNRARGLLDAAMKPRWASALRALGAMAHLARLDLARPDRPAGHPTRAMRLLWHRLTGR